MANTSISLIIPHEAGKALQLLFRKEYKSPLDRPLSVQRLNSTYDSKILMMVLEAVM